MEFNKLIQIIAIRVIMSRQGKVGHPHYVLILINCIP